MSPEQFSSLKEVRQPIPLTERSQSLLHNLFFTRLTYLLFPEVWAHISPAVLEFMENIKAIRLLREHAAIVLERKKLAIEVLRKYKNTRLPCTEAMPEAADFFAFPAVSVIFKQESAVVVDESSFSGVILILPELVSKWQADIASQLGKKLQSDYVQNNKKDTEHELDITSFPENLILAKNVFVCSSCARLQAMHDYDSSDSDSDGVAYTTFSKPIVKPMYYPEVLAHRCLTRQYPYFDFGAYRDPSLCITERHGHRRPWTCRQISLSEDTGTIVEQIVRVSGLDPSITTVEHMDKLDARFACITCVLRESDCHVFGWRSAVSPPSHLVYVRRLTDIILDRYYIIALRTTVKRGFGVSSPTNKHRRRVEMNPNLQAHPRSIRTYLKSQIKTFWLGHVLIAATFRQKRLLLLLWPLWTILYRRAYLQSFQYL